MFQHEQFLFGFLIAITVYKQQHSIEAEWRLFVHGVPQGFRSLNRPEIVRISDAQWHEAVYLSQNAEKFKNLGNNLTNNWNAWQQVIEARDPLAKPLPPDFAELTQFENLMLMKILRPDKLEALMRNFISATLSEEFLKQPVRTLQYPLQHNVLISISEKSPGKLPELAYPSISLPLTLSRLETMLNALKEAPVVVVYNVHLQHSWRGIKALLEDFKNIFIYVGRNKWKDWMQSGHKMVLEQAQDAKAILLSTFQYEPR